MTERIGIVSGGGDCSDLNAVIRVVVKSASRCGWETIGFLGGCEGLLNPIQSRPLDYRKMDGMLFLGFTSMFLGLALFGVICL
ncbi:MAG: 6-phosphofructokinase [Anaerolineales bacterium]